MIIKEGKKRVRLENVYVDVDALNATKNVKNKVQKIALTRVRFSFSFINNN